MILSAAINPFYGLKQIAGNIPVDGAATDATASPIRIRGVAPLQSNGQGMRPIVIHLPASFPSVSSGPA